MGGMRLTELGFGRDRLQPHGPQEPRHPFGIHDVAWLPEPHGHAADTIKRRPRVRFIQQAHHLKVLGTLPLGSIVNTRPR